MSSAFKLLSHKSQITSSHILCKRLEFAPILAYL